MLVAPVVDQFSELVAPAVMLEGLATKEVMTGEPGTVTVTVAVLVTEPALLVAVSVYVVVADGETLVDPLAEVEVKEPGVMASVMAPLVAQARVVLAPELTVVGVAVKELMDGGVAPPGGLELLAVPAQPAIAKLAKAEGMRSARGKNEERRI